MTAKVITFTPRPVPHVTGEALCLDCKHDWVAVMPVDDFFDAEGWLKCPACLLVRGRMKYPHMRPEGTLKWQCDCGNTLFELTTDGASCPNCGRLHNPEFP